MGYTLPDGTTVQWRIRTARRQASSADVWDTAQWDIASWDGGSVLFFEDLTEQRVHSFNIKSGKDRFGRRFKASSVTLTVDNRDGVFTTDLMQPGDYVWITATIQPPAGIPDTPIPDGTMWLDTVGNLWTSHGSLILADEDVPIPIEYDVWYGRVDSATDIVLNGIDVTRIVGYDGFAELATVDKDALPAQGAGEDVFARVLRIGNNASTAFGGILSSATPGAATMQATTLAANALLEVQLAVESEGGDVWSSRTFAANGKALLEVRGRDWLTTDTKSTVVQWFFGGSGSQALPLINGRLSREAQLLLNSVTISNAGGVSQEVTDNASIQRNGERTFRRLDLIAETDAQALFLAQRFVANLKDIRPRTREVTVDVTDSRSALFAATVAMGDLCQSTISSIHGWNFTTQSHVIGIMFEVFEQQWRVVLNLDDAFVDNVDGAYDYQAFSEAFSLGGQP